MAQNFTRSTLMVKCTKAEATSRKDYQIKRLRQAEKDQRLNDKVHFEELTYATHVKEATSVEQILKKIKRLHSQGK